MVEKINILNRYSMRKLLLVCYCCFAGAARAGEVSYTRSFFTNSGMPGFYFFSRAAAADGSFIKADAGKLPVSEEQFHTPGNALLLHYRNAPGGWWQASVFSREIRGMDHFRRAAYLSLWIYAEVENTHSSELPVLQMMKSDSSLTEKAIIPLDGQSRWQRVLIPLSSFGITGIADPREWIGLVCSQNPSSTAGEYRIWLDDIEMAEHPAERSLPGIPHLTGAKGYARHADITWDQPADAGLHLVKVYRSTDGKNFQPVGVQQPGINRYSDYTSVTGKKYFYRIACLNRDYTETRLSNTVSVSTREMTDEDLLTMVQEASFRYYWEAAESNSGLARENIPGRKDMIATGASGFGLMALVAGTERRFITRTQAVNRFLKILRFLEQADRFHGVYPHFINGPSGKTEPFFGARDNGADLVETAFLMQGLLTARQYFSANTPAEKEIRDRIGRIWRAAEWSWFRKTEDSDFLYWHWSPDQAWVINHPLIGWNETMITYLLAIASPTHPVPASMYYSGWANRDATGRQYRQGWGQTPDGAGYANGNTYEGIQLEVGVSNGGPLFFTHYSFMGFDPRRLTDAWTNYFANNRNIAEINYRYCIRNPKGYLGYGDSTWGLTASDGPFDYSADEPVERQDRGKIAPTGAMASFPYLPVPAMKALKNYYFNYGRFLWGEFGFRDAFDLTRNWCSEIYMGLNQGPMTVMIENYRTGLIWKLFMQNPEIQEGLQKLAAETDKRKYGPVK